MVVKYYPNLFYIPFNSSLKVVLCMGVSVQVPNDNLIQTKSQNQLLILHHYYGSYLKTEKPKFDG